ncbi:putative uncharacterized protein [Janthinobacterium agaricidamnosum NBRC 102515 = DSM 9628]|uniref:DUF4136 domain-containing protein n=2 Tax=Janthinobacterium agaricidamnosum TaxID=55508 RepID=W0UYK5_9BURK|nr:putative uncharacterized protein [Janthinobacterium agaricidamnosum NBRC 102515 = DSM 9628]
MTLLLSGCATTIRSDVTAFNEWPVGLQEKTYTFQAAAPEHDTLEYRSYLNLVRGELAKLGFREVDRADAAKLKVVMNFSTTDLPVRVLEATDPFYGPGYWGGRYGYGGPWGYRGWYGYRSPFYDPFLYGPSFEESVRHNFERQLRVTIDGTDGKKLFDVTVHNTSRKASTAVVMPAMVASAFANFPGQNGVPHRIDLKVE